MVTHIRAIRHFHSTSYDKDGREVTIAQTTIAPLCFDDGGFFEWEAPPRLVKEWEQVTCSRCFQAKREYGVE